jgi:hypothetical protein
VNGTARGDPDIFSTIHIVSGDLPKQNPPPVLSGPGSVPAQCGPGAPYVPGLRSADPPSDAIHLEDSPEQGVQMSSSEGGPPGMQQFSDGGRGRSVGGRAGKGGFLSIRTTIAYLFRDRRLYRC